MKQSVSKFKKDSQNLGMPEAAVFLLKKFQSMYDDLRALLMRSMKHMAISCDTVTTMGGSAVEEILDPNIKPSMHCTATVTELGANPVTILAAKCEMGKIIITFSADPSNDHKVTYHVCK